MSSSKRALGRGLGALLGTSIATTPKEGSIHNVALDEIEPNPFQPRRNFSEESIADLANSIDEGLLLQPIAVRKLGDRYQIINGERRFRAFSFLKKQEIPALILELDDRQMLISALVENIQREDLNAVDEALSFESLSSQFNLTHDEIALQVGKSRSHITNSLRLLKLPPSVRNFVVSSLLSPGAARALLPLDKEDLIKQFASETIVNGWNVRQVEAQVKNYLKELSKPVPTKLNESPEIDSQYMNRLKTLIKLPFNLRKKKKGFELKLTFEDKTSLESFISSFH